MIFIGGVNQFTQLYTNSNDVDGSYKEITRIKIKISFKTCLYLL